MPNRFEPPVSKTTVSVMATGLMVKKTRIIVAS